MCDKDLGSRSAPLLGFCEELKQLAQRSRISLDDDEVGDMESG